MKAIEILNEEHRVIKSFLAVQRKATELLDKGQIRPGFFIEAAEFIKGFVDDCHNKKEEDILFATIREERDIAHQNELIDMLLLEHEKGGAYICELREAAQKMEAGEVSARDVVWSDAWAYIRLKMNHVLTEDYGVFPLAETIIMFTRQEEMLNEDFERTMKGVLIAYEMKYLVLLHELAKEVGL